MKKKKKDVLVVIDTDKGTERQVTDRDRCSINNRKAVEEKTRR